MVLRGKPLALKLTVPENPRLAVTVTVGEFLSPVDPTGRDRNGKVCRHHQGDGCGAAHLPTAASDCDRVRASGSRKAGCNAQCGRAGGVQGRGMNDPVAPVGSPLKLKSTVPVNPRDGVTRSLFSK